MCAWAVATVATSWVSSGKISAYSAVSGLLEFPASVSEIKSTFVGGAERTPWACRKVKAVASGLRSSDEVSLLLDPRPAVRLPSFQPPPSGHMHHRTSVVPRFSGTSRRAAPAPAAGAADAPRPGGGITFRIAGW